MNESALLLFRTCVHETIIQNDQNYGMRAERKCQELRRVTTEKN